jgi:hypothetical protein
MYDSDFIFLAQGAGGTQATQLHGDTFFAFPCYAKYVFACFFGTVVVGGADRTDTIRFQLFDPFILFVS